MAVIQWCVPCVFAAPGLLQPCGSRPLNPLWSPLTIIYHYRPCKITNNVTKFLQMFFVLLIVFDSPSVVVVSGIDSVWCFCEWSGCCHHVVRGVEPGTHLLKENFALARLGEIAGMKWFYLFPGLVQKLFGEFVYGQESPYISTVTSANRKRLHVKWTF